MPTSCVRPFYVQAREMTFDTGYRMQCVAALKVFVSIILQICLAISGSVHVTAIISACVDLLTGCCTAFLNVFLALQVCEYNCWFLSGRASSDSVAQALLA